MSNHDEDDDRRRVASRRTGMLKNQSNQEKQQVSVHSESRRLVNNTKYKNKSPYGILKNKDKEVIVIDCEDNDGDHNNLSVEESCEVNARGVAATSPMRGTSSRALKASNMQYFINDPKNQVSSIFSSSAAVDGSIEEEKKSPEEFYRNFYTSSTSNVAFFNKDRNTFPPVNNFNKRFREQNYFAKQSNKRSKRAEKEKLPHYSINHPLQNCSFGSNAHRRSCEDHGVEHEKVNNHYQATSSAMQSDNTIDLSSMDDAAFDKFVDQLSQKFRADPMVAEGNQEEIVRGGKKDECKQRDPQGSISFLQTIPKKHHTESSDFKLAKRLQQEEDNVSQRANAKKEKYEMAKSTSGKAVLVVQKIIKLVKKVKNTVPNFAHHIEEVAVDDMVYLAERLLEQQDSFRNHNVPSYIDIGYHYTSAQNIQAIRTNGLLTRGDRARTNVQSVSRNGSTFGDGIYTANNPVCFRKYGDLGLLVGRLQGKTVKVPVKLTKDHGKIDANTIIGDKKAETGKAWPSTDSKHEIVLRSSSQCLPMLKYDRAIIDEPGGIIFIRRLEVTLQKILDVLFNQGARKSFSPDSTMRTKLSEEYCGQSSLNSPSAAHSKMPNSQHFLPNQAINIASTSSSLGSMTTRSMATQSMATQLMAQRTSSNLTPPKAMVSKRVLKDPPMGNTKISKNSRLKFGLTQNLQSNGVVTIIYKAPTNLTKGILPNAFNSPICQQDLDNNCAICHDKLSNHFCVQLKGCYHTFHQKCLDRALQTQSQCPICRKAIGEEPQGKSPSGIMTVMSASNLHCAGYPNEGSFVIKYHMKEGLQKSYHENPGQQQHGKRVKAYLPDNIDGRNLLKRLKFAFSHGLTFTVGTSVTTGRPNQCTWSSIHHKTSLSGGTHNHGFPDDFYFKNCNEELDNVGVPPVHSLSNGGGKKDGLGP